MLELSMTVKRIARSLAWVFIILVVTRGMYLTLGRKNDCQSDFEMYRYACVALSKGMDPYQLSSISAIAGEHWIKMYTYHPFTLFLLQPFVSMGDRIAYPLYFFIRLSCAAGLVVLWWKFFLKKDCPLVFLLIFSVFACNGSMRTDFDVGNVEVFEALPLWLAFAFYLKRRIGLFCLFVVVSSVFRLSPIIFLLLALFSGSRRRYLSMGIAVGAFLAYFFLAYCDPRLFMRSFVDLLGGISSNRFASLDVGGILQPSGFAAISEATRRFFPGWGGLHLAFYVSYAVMISTVSFVLTRTFFHQLEEKDLVYLSCFLYVLIVPRFKDYSYYLLVPCLLSAILTLPSTRIRWDWILFVLVCVPYMPRLAGFLYSYQPLVTVFGIWILFLIELRQKYEKKIPRIEGDMSPSP